MAGGLISGVDGFEVIKAEFPQSKLAESHQKTLKFLSSRLPPRFRHFLLKKVDD
jgi:hypothetical protein